MIRRFVVPRWHRGRHGARIVTHDGGMILRAYKYALDPTAAQQQMLRSHCGAQRFAYNWALGAIRANWAQRAAEASYGVADEALTPLMDWSSYSLRKAFNAVKDDIAPWWSENSKEAYASGLANLAAALRNWAACRSAGRRGTRMGFPRFKTKKSALACRFSTGAIGLSDSDRRHVKLPRIGYIRTHESTRKLARRIEAGSARIRSATVSYSKGRWVVSFSVEVQPNDRVPARGSLVLGLDLGITNLAVLSIPVQGVSDDQGMVANPQRYEAIQRRLRTLHRRAARRRGPDQRAGVTPSKRWERTHQQIARLHRDVANGRADALHKLTSAVTKRCGVIVIEDLYVAGMMRNHSLARRIAGAGWGELRRQLTYKTKWSGGYLVIANRFFASSKTCSGCGAVKDKLCLSERVYHCDRCELRIDRDINAARNLAALAAVGGSSSSPSCGATQNEPDGNPRQTGSSAGSGYGHGKSHVGNVARR